jgi:hypothetical protein
LSFNKLNVIVSPLAISLYPETGDAMQHTELIIFPSLERNVKLNACDVPVKYLSFNVLKITH